MIYGLDRDDLYNVDRDDLDRDLYDVYKCPNRNVMSWKTRAKNANTVILAVLHVFPGRLTTR